MMGSCCPMGSSSRCARDAADRPRSRIPRAAVGWAGHHSMSLDTAAITSDFEVLRRSREARPNSPWRRLVSWRQIEWALRWILGIAPVVVSVGIMEYGYIGHDHG